MAINFANDGAGGLTAPLPAGTVRVYVDDIDGIAKFIGEEAIGHAPVGSDISINTGDAFDVTVQPTEVLNRSAGWRRNEVKMRLAVRNAKPEPVVVHIRHKGIWRSLQLIEESHPSDAVDAASREWPLTVNAGSETVLEYTARIIW